MNCTNAVHTYTTDTQDHFYDFPKIYIYIYMCVCMYNTAALIT